MGLKANHSNKQLEIDKYLKEIQDKEHEIIRLNKELEKVNQELKTCSQTDALTGVFNRPVFENVLKKEWERCKRNLIPLSLIAVDVDFFKAYNDVYGYQAGDECLKKVAGVLAECARRSSDTVSRFGGDKFIIIVPHLMKNYVFDLAGHIENRIAELCIPHTSSVAAQQVTVSIGVHTIIPADDLSVQDFIKIAEIALYEAKSEHNSIVIE